MQVSDGHHKDRFTVMNVFVTALTLSMWNVSQSEIVQGEISTSITAMHVVSNGSPHSIIYNVTRPPRHGQIYRKDKPVHRFR